MNIARFDSEFEERLLADKAPNFPASLRRFARLAAIREYSRIKPLRRRFGTGNTVNAALATQDTLYVAGGPFQQGDTITIDAYSPNSETFTVSSSANASDAAEQLGTIQKIVLSDALVNNHPSGAFVARNTLGLSAIEGQDTYWLPLDFIDIEENSFDLAFGIKSAAQRINTFWGGTDYANLLGGAGWGTASNYLATNTFFNMPVPIPFSSAGLPNPGRGMVTTYTFYDGPPHLVISPAPSGTGGPFAFDYLATHIPETISDYHIEALVAYAAYTCYVAREGALAGTPSYKADYRELFSHLSAGAMQKAAERALDDWYNRLAARPILVSG